MSYGFASHIGIGKETTWGTPVAATDYFEAFSESMATERDRFETRNVVGAYYEADDSAGLERHAGELVLHGHPVSMGYFMEGALGINTVTSLAADLFRNEMTPRQSDFGSFHPLTPYTLEMFRAGTTVNSSFQYSGAQIAGLTLGLAINQDIRVTANVIAKSRAFIAKTTPSFPGSPAEAFLFDTVSLAWPSGTANTQIEALTVSIDNQLEGLGAFNNSVQIAKIRRSGPPLIRVNGTLDFQDLDRFNDFVNQIEREITVAATKPNSFSLVITIPRLILTGVPVAIPGKERITTDFTGIARYHAGSGTAIKMDLTTVNTF